MLILSKAECRKLFREKREELSPNQRRVMSEQIALLLFTHFNLEQKTVSLFLPIEQKKEINTYIILEKAMDMNASVCLPKANFETNELKHFIYEGPEQLETSAQQIPEPKYGKTMSPKKIQYVIVPLLAFDKRGYRVGYGKGFYDKFLKKCNSETLFIGLSFFEGIAEISDVISGDVPLHYIITPEQKIRI
jgi:5-formyltetrahydrofolate cyclo-ligase